MLPLWGRLIAWLIACQADIRWRSSTATKSARCSAAVRTDAKRATSPSRRACLAWLNTPLATYSLLLEQDLVPFLILFATLLFMVQETIQRKLKTGSVTGRRSRQWFAGAILFQLLAALYGGYFGAGIGILMLAVLIILSLTDIHQMNGLKNFFALCINGVAALYFIWAQMVYWPDVIINGNRSRGRRLWRRRRSAQDRTYGSAPHRDRDRVRNGPIAVYQAIADEAGYQPATSLPHCGAGTHECVRHAAGKVCEKCALLGHHPPDGQIALHGHSQRWKRLDAGAFHLRVGQRRVLGAARRGPVFPLIGGLQLRMESRSLENQLGVFEPRDGGPPTGVVDARAVALQQIQGARGKHRRISRRGHVVFHHTNRMLRRRAG